MAGKPGMVHTKKKAVKYSEATCDFICEQLEAGLSISQMLKEHPDRIPSRSTISQWKRKDGEFALKFEVAYQSFIRTHLDEFNKVAMSRLEELYPDLDFRHGCEQRRAMIEYYKFMLAKIAPKILPELADRITIGQLEKPIVEIINYCKKAGKEIVINNRLEEMAIIEGESKRES